ncbi:DsbE family thiol:disulfide interchange protein [uncultured Brevundimonas sp.]|uniref:DsbE family thiol:disulfide interchange protein n=1 Tax=uncultured Brevundimonas sp. TaxID=213418 RepID=UPI0030ED0A61|tara:strand:+ start:74878 stop:75444 length:567 start_codon:yes stop_codon:yes gene_type:complete
MNRWLSLIPLAVVAALAALFIGWSLKRDPAFKPDALVGQPIPETVLPLLTGDQAGPGVLDLKTAGVGRPMIVNVFASWCAPCQVENPTLLAMKAQGVAIVGVAYKDDPVATRAFLEEFGNPFAMVLVDREGRAGLDLGVSGVPESFAVNATGQVVAKHSGPLIDAADIAQLTAALQAPPRPLPTATRR